ncbi:MAG: hypothetical protein OXS35_08750 [Dehalococcoidia bacterium]|nr:hypothetical protein [Dehalococcoidia bacterium]
MAELSREQVLALARAVGVDLDDSELTEVAHHVSAVLAAMDAIDEPGLHVVEPMPMPMNWPPADGRY